MAGNTTREHVTADCTVEFPEAVDAAADLTLQIRVACTPPCDLEGQTIEITDENGAVIAAVELGAYDEQADANLTDSIRIKAPASAGDYRWSAKLAAYEDDEVDYGEAVVPIAFTVTAHTTTVLVWDVPSSIVVGDPFRIKVGIKCSCGCRQADREFVIRDHEGIEVAKAKVGSEIWPESAALHFAEVELTAPTDAALVEWLAQCADIELPADDADGSLPHAAGANEFRVRSVNRPDYKIRVEAWDASKQAPLAGARVVLPPYGTLTDENGIAELSVAGGNYQLFVSRTKYTTFGTPVEVAGDINTKIELSLEPPSGRE